MADRLTLTRAFERACLKSDDAERIATEIYDAIHDNVATKTEFPDPRATVAAWFVDRRRCLVAICRFALLAAALTTQIRD